MRLLPSRLRIRSGGGVRWWICALLFLATTINYLDRQILSLLKPMLDTELHWTNSQFGLINSCFLGAYAMGVLFFGWFVDRVGVKAGYAVSIIAWSLSAIAHAFVGSIAGFMAARIFLGLGEAGNFPAAIKAVAQWFPKSERALATAIFNSGANMGAIAAPLFVPWLMLAWSWHAPFLVAGLLGLVWVGVWWLFYESPSRMRGVSEEERAWIEGRAAQQDESAPVPWRRLLGCRQAWSFIAAKFLTDPIWFFFLIWLPDYFKKTRGLDLKSSWSYLVTIYVIVTVLSLAGGWLTGHLCRAGWSVTRARKTGLALFALLVTPIFAVETAQAWVAVFLIGLAGAAHQAWSANLYTTVSDMFPKGAISSVIGFGTMAGSLGSMIFIYFCGQVLDHYGQTGALTGYHVLFAYCACAYLVAFLVNHLLAPSFAPMDAGPAVEGPCGAL